jgi:GntR family phosphonate transport system transcriptional regulator
MNRDGTSIWRQISRTLSEEIDEGVLSPGQRLPASADLAARFGVNRHTVLRAISHLQDEGLVRTERGGGIYVERAIPYRMGARTRLEENLIQLNRVPSRTILSVIDMPAPTPVAAALELAPGDDVVLVTLLGAADGIPISYNRNYFPAARIGGIGDAFRAAAKDPHADLATKTVLASLGVRDFRRKSVRIRARDAGQDELRHLRIPASETVFEVDVTNVDETGSPVTYGSTAFPITRVEFVLELD